jgi:hypothetical protein
MFHGFLLDTEERRATSMPHQHTAPDRANGSASEKNRPAKEFRLGRVKAVIWLNEGEKGSWYTIQFQRLYKEAGAKDWKTSESFGRDDLPLLQKVADMAHTYCYETGAQS